MNRIRVSIAAALATIAIVASVSCSQTANVRAAADVRQRAAVVQRVFDEVLNQGRYELFADSYDATFVKHVNDQRYNLKEEIEQAKGTRAMATDLVMTIDNLIVDGDFVAVQYTGRGTNSGAFGGTAGKKFALSGATVYRFKGSKIVEEWTYYDGLELRKQLGLATSSK